MCPTHQKTSWIKRVTVLVWVKNCLRKFTALVWLNIWLGKFLLNVGSSWFCLGEIAWMVGRKSGSENPVLKRPSPTLGGSDSCVWCTTILIFSLDIGLIRPVVCQICFALRGNIAVRTVVNYVGHKYGDKKESIGNKQAKSRCTCLEPMFVWAKFFIFI